jgi:hypothetical protein
MFFEHFDLARKSILAVSLAGVMGISAAAQEQPGLSSGSGQGTGSGLSTGVQRNATGSMSGSGAPSSGLGRQVLPPDRLPGGTFGTSGYGPGVNVRFPDDPFLIPFMSLEQFGGPVDPNAPTGVTPELLKRAREISTPEERSLALQRLAKGAIASNQLTLAHQTLEEAATAVDSISDPLVHDQRLIALVTSLNALSRELVREGLGERPLRDLDLGGGQQAPQNHMDGALIIRMERLEWKRAVHLASNISNPTYRSEYLYRVVESMASGSKTIANGFPKTSEALVSQGNNPGASQGEDARTEQFRKLADEILVDSFDVAKQIDRLVWKFQAMVQIALQAANSQQFKRGVELCLQIDNAKSRAESLLLLADPMCRREHSVSVKLEKPLPKDDRGYVTFRFPPQLNSRLEFQGEWDSDPRKSGDPRKLVQKGFISKAEYDQLAALLDDRVYQKALAELSRLYNAAQDAATPVFQEAAKATASIETDGLRGVVTGLLVDGLTGAGRFDDARACTAIYPLESERFVALGAIAEAMGRRGAADSARRWIAEEAPEDYRSALYRRVTDGELWVVEENRGRQTLKGLEEMPRVP